MSIEQTSVIDFIGTNKENGNITLSISDHMDWSNQNEHLRLLQDKINAYLRFIESGEIYTNYPDAKGRNINIEIIAKYNFTEKSNEFFVNAKKIIHNAGFNLIFSHIEERNK